MVLAKRQRRRIAQILSPVIAAAVVAYFAYYTVEGERGLIALGRLQAQAVNAEASLAELKREHQALELEVMSLRPGSLDLDRLDERARTLLNTSRTDELIVKLPNTAPPKP